MTRQTWWFWVHAWITAVRSRWWRRHTSLWLWSTYVIQTRLCFGSTVTTCRVRHARHAYHLSRLMIDWFTLKCEARWTQRWTVSLHWIHKQTHFIITQSIRDFNAILATFKISDFPPARLKLWHYGTVQYYYYYFNSYFYYYYYYYHHYDKKPTVIGKNYYCWERAEIVRQCLE